MPQFLNKKIDIILPWRIGDAILNIPMLIAFKQLNKKYNSYKKIRIIAQPFLAKLYEPLEIFECKPLTLTNKIFSHLKPADIAFFTETINSNWGYTAKKTYGLTNIFKKTIKFDKELLFMNIKKFREFLPNELISFLQNKYGLSQYSISLFGILLELGYTSEQIMETFDFSPKCLALKNFNEFFHPVMNEKYVVFCMEAAYGKKGDANRRWDENYYIEIANKCFEEFNLKSVFVGIDKSFKLPDKPNFIDLRKQLDLFKLTQVLKLAVYYIGNDTAPLHIANIMQTPSVGAYFMQHSLTDFGPIFPNSNVKVFCPQTSEELYNEFKQSYIAKADLSQPKVKSQQPIKKIAIVFGAKIGDVVNVQPVCRVLKQAYPEVKLVFVTWPGAVEIAKLLPEVDYVETFDNKGKGKNPFIFLKDALRIRFKHKIDLAVVINDSFTYSLLAFLVGAKNRIGRHKVGLSFFLNKKYSLTDEDLTEIHVTKSYLKAIEPIGLTTNDSSLALKTDFDSQDIEYVENLIAEYSDKKLIGFSPCSALEHKDWTPEESKKFIDLINQTSDYKVVLTGDYVAKDFASKIRELGTDDFLDLSCKTNLKQLLILFKKFEKFVTVDTGSAHLAYVLKIPTLVMFFMNHYKYWGPMDLSINKIIYKPDRYSLLAEEVFQELNLMQKLVNSHE